MEKFVVNYSNGLDSTTFQMLVSPTCISFVGQDENVSIFTYKDSVFLFDELRYELCVQHSTGKFYMTIHQDDYNHVYELYNSYISTLNQQKELFRRFLMGEGANMDIISYDLLQLLEENVFCLTFEDAKQYVDRLKAYILRNHIYEHPSRKEIFKSVVTWLKKKHEIFQDVLITELKNYIEGKVQNISLAITQVVKMEPIPFASGGQGDVFKGILIENGKPVVVKKIPLAGKDGRALEEKTKNSFMREISVMNQFKERDIASYYYYYADANDLYLIMDFYEGGSLCNYIISRKAKTLTEKEARPIIRNVIKAVQKLHARNIIHRDIKLENIMLRSIDNPEDIVLIDLGFAREADMEKYLMTRGIGTTEYESPEIANRDAEYSFEVDVWSIMCCLYCLVLGCFPFGRYNDTKILDRICNGAFKKDTRYRQLSAELQYLFDHSFYPMSQDRLSLDDILHSDWMNLDDINNDITFPFAEIEGVDSIANAVGTQTFRWNMYNEVYTCLDLVEGYRDIWDGKHVLYFASGDEFEVNEARNVNGDFWVRVNRFNRSHPPMYEDYHGIWVCVQKYREKAMAVPKRCHYFFNNDTAPHRVFQYPTYDSQSLADLEIDNIIINRTENTGEITFGELHQQTLSCFNIPQFTWIPLFDGITWPFTLIYPMDSCVCENKQSNTHYNNRT